MPSLSSQNNDDPYATDEDPLTDEDDDASGKGYTTEEEAQIMFDVWKTGHRAREHARIFENRGPSPAQNRYRIPSPRNRTGIPLADRTKVGEWLPVTRESHPDAFRPVDEVWEQTLRGRELDRTIREGKQELETAERKFEAVQSENRRLWLAGTRGAELGRVEQQIEGIRRRQAHLAQGLAFAEEWDQSEGAVWQDQEYTPEGKKRSPKKMRLV